MKRKLFLVKQKVHLGQTGTSLDPGTVINLHEWPEKLQNSLLNAAHAGWLQPLQDDPETTIEPPPEQLAKPWSIFD